MALTKIVAIFLICIGVATTGYYGFQWWQSSQAVETVSLAEVDGWSINDTKQEAAPPALPAPEKPPEKPSVLMSEDMDQYEAGDEVGRLVIPAIEKGYPTYWGADEATLDQGVGMYVSKWTTTPDQKRHTVVSGHRNTVFIGLDKIEKGDSIFLEYGNERFEYAVDDMWVTGADDRTVITDKDEATLTLTTCYPFDFVGYAPDRYIIEAQLVNVQDI